MTSGPSIPATQQPGKAKGMPPYMIPLFSTVSFICVVGAAVALLMFKKWDSEIFTMSRSDPPEDFILENSPESEMQPLCYVGAQSKSRKLTPFLYRD